MAIDYNDQRFINLTNEKNNAISQNSKIYDDFIQESKNQYQNLIDNSKNWADKQVELQNERNDFTINQINQQKEQAKKDYTKEQKGAYQDYMKQSNPYGSQMQNVGQNGLSGSGWSETIRSGFYNTYQNRYAQARESYNLIQQNYDNNITEATLQNNSKIAEIYANAYQEQLNLSLQQFTVLKDLTLQKQSTNLALDSEYNNRWRQVESQINTENSLAEQIREYNERMAYQRERDRVEDEQWQKEYNLSQQSLNNKLTSSNSLSSSTSSNKSTSSTNSTNTNKTNGTSVGSLKSSSNSSSNKSKKSNTESTKKKGTNIFKQALDYTLKTLLNI